MSECTCHLSHPSYAGFIGNHSPMCPANREQPYNATPDLLKQLGEAAPVEAERISDEDIIKHLGFDESQSVSKFNSMVNNAWLERNTEIIKQQQSDIRELKALLGHVSFNAREAQNFLEANLNTPLYDKDGDRWCFMQKGASQFFPLREMEEVEPFTLTTGRAG